jgi:hypothetical protein
MAIVTILEAFLGKLICKEIEAWLPQAGRRLLNFAVSKLPAHERSRYAEEWSADLANIPGDLSRALFALGLLKAAWGIHEIEKQQHELIRAMDRNRGKVLTLVLCDENLPTSRHERIGQLLRITVPNREQESIVAKLLASTGMKVYKMRK